MIEGGPGEEEPLFLGKIHGVRGWTMIAAQLHGAYYRATWNQNGEPTRAQCTSQNVHPPHEAPSNGCGCGLYGLHPWAAEPHGDVYGVIEAWGRVELHATGFRAEYARPVALFSHRRDPASQALAEAHGCELIKIRSLADVGTICTERGWGMTREVVRSLVPTFDEEIADPGPVAWPIPRNSGPARGDEWLVVRVMRGLAFGVFGTIFGLIGVAFWALQAAFLGVLAVALINVATGWTVFGLDLGTKDPAPLELVRESEVRIAAEGILPTRGGRPPIYVARLVNRGSHPSVWARPSLLIRSGTERRRVPPSDFAYPAVVPAGGSALVAHPLQRRDADDTRVRAGPVLARGSRRPAGVPAKLSLEFERKPDGSCAAAVRVRSEASLHELGFWVLGLTKSGSIRGVIPGRVRGLSRGDSRHPLRRIRPCSPAVVGAMVVPAYRPGQLVERAIASS